MLKPYHAVLSLETMGMSTNAVVFELAAVRIENGEITQNVYHQYPNIKSCEHYGLTTEGEVVMEWLKMAEHERKDKTLKRYKPDLKLALQLFTQWLEHQADDTMIWMRGAAFRMSVLENAYDKCCLSVPWRRGNVHSLDTLLLALASENIDVTFEPPAMRVNAMSDAQADAAFLLKWLKHLEDKEVSTNDKHSLVCNL